MRIAPYFTLAALLSSAALIACGGGDAADDTTSDTTVADDTGTADDSGMTEDSGMTDDTGATDDTGTVQDTGSMADTMPEDTGTVEDTMPEDTGTVEDTMPEDTGTTEDVDPMCGALGEACCESGTACVDGLTCMDGICATDGGSCPASLECLAPPIGTPDAPISQVAGPTPTLAGGTIADSVWSLDAVEVYSDNTFTDLVSVEIASNGNTYGTLEFAGAAFALDMNLDLGFHIEALGNVIDEVQESGIYAASCFTSDGTGITGDFLACGGSWVADMAPPSTLDYEVSGDAFTLLVVIDQAALTAALPEEYQSLAGLAISGDLPILTRFSRR